MAPWFKYSALQDKNVEDKDFNNDSTEEFPTPKQRRCFGFSMMLAFAGGLAIGIALSIAFNSLSSIIPQKLPVPSRSGLYTTKIVNGGVIEGTQCGDSWQEAKALGCIYDKMASRWYSPECFDKVSFDAMMSEPGTNFTWFLDKKHTVQVPSEIAQNGEFELLYPLHDFHKIHCLYLWRKMHHALLNNLPLDDDLMEEDHTIHCTKNLLTWPDPKVQEVASIAHAGRPFCRRNPLGLLPLDLA